ncbi:MAG: polysaccharide deacetylase family protein [Gammaproteobacteria bacterium]|nr:polysaccharide deacetylase family protein [Gammaproteobacteria bacterium]
MNNNDSKIARLSSSLMERWIERASPAGEDGKLLVVKYHRVQSTLSLGKRLITEFETQMKLVSRMFNVLTIAEAAKRIKENSLPARALSITFDDGYADNYDLALPVLERHGLKATFFVTSGLLDQSGMWSDQIASILVSADKTRAAEIRDYLVDAGVPPRLPDLVNELKYMSVDAQETIVSGLSKFGDAVHESSKLMNADQLRSLVKKGMEVGGHTVNHKILNSLEDDQARHEIKSCKAQLESIIDAPVESFAYPNGRRNQDYTDREVSFVREAGFKAAVSTEYGLARSGTDTFELPRISAEYFVRPLRLCRVYL